jgi:hypothetical protein
VVEVAHQYRVCLRGFDPEQASVHITVFGPDGGEVRSEDVAASQGGAIWLLSPLPGDPRGDYTFEASQPPPEGQEQSLVATGSFAVIMADDPVMAPLIRSGPVGTTFRFALAGFEGGSTQPLYLYGRVGQAMEFLTTLPPVTMDHEGEATYDLPTVLGDPPGSYAVATDESARAGRCGVSARCSTFELTG